VDGNRSCGGSSLTPTRFVRTANVDYYLTSGKPDPGYAFLPCMDPDGDHACVTVKIVPAGVERIAWAHHDDGQMRACFLIDSLSSYFEAAASEGYTPGWDDEPG
jgi:hypothetical protein